MFFTKLAKMTHANKVMNPQHFGSNPADIWIQIWINSEIRIRIQDHFWSRVRHWGGLHSPEQ